jgi:hypothetical protein
MKSLFSQWLMRLISLACLSAPSAAFAAEFDGAQLTAVWGIPFAGILLCIALMPLLTPIFGTTITARWLLRGPWHFSFRLPSCLAPIWLARI